MDSSSKPVTKKRVIVGWRQAARRISENRQRHNFPSPKARVTGK